MVQLTGRETIVVGECRTCDYKENMLVGRMDLAKWKGGLYIQEAMPYLTAEQRELLNQ